MKTKNKKNLTQLEIYQKKLAKIEGRDFIIQSFATLILPLVFSFQFYVGGWRNFSYSKNMGLLLILFFIFNILSLIIYPKFNLNYINKYFMKVGHTLFKIINTIILATFYLLTLPFSATIGRNKIIKQRRELTPWVKGGDNWRVTTWRDGGYQNKISQKKGFIKNLIFVFLRERNLFLLIMLILILIISTIILFAQSSAVAPFIYTIF